MSFETEAAYVTAQRHKAEAERRKMELYQSAGLALASALPAELLQMILAAELSKVLHELTANYGTADLKRVVQAAVEKKTTELLETTYAADVAKLADQQARDALAFARHKLTHTEKTR